MHHFWFGLSAWKSYKCLLKQIRQQRHGYGNFLRPEIVFVRPAHASERKYLTMWDTIGMLYYSYRTMIFGCGCF